VALLTVALVMGLYVMLALLARGDEILGGTRVVYDPDFAQGTRMLAQLLPPYLTGSSGRADQLEQLLQGLGQEAVPGSGPLGGTVNAGTGIVVVAVDGNVLAFVPGSGMPAGAFSLAQLEPPEWRTVLAAALDGERDLSADGPLVRVADGGRILVSAYPIVTSDGRLLGAVGLRTQPAGTATLSPGANLVALAVAAGAALLELLLVAALPAVAVSAVASILLTRRMMRQLEELESASEAIVHGDLGRRVAVLARDELGRLAERFNLLTAALERSETQRRRFFANITHDLRTPLAVIRAQAEALAEQQLAPDTHLRTGLERIVEETEVLGRLVDDLFTLARLEERGLSLTLQPLDLQPLVASVVETMRPLARRAGYVALAADAAAHCPPVLADALRLRQVLVNLLHNALRHTPEGGVIRVTVRPEGDWVVLSVRDTGCGIPASALEELFTRYHRTSDPASGGGLGLAVAKQLVEAQGGRIRIASVPQEGTEVTVMLPVATAACAGLPGGGDAS
jgi:signal transduction histidine kinase